MAKRRKTIWRDGCKLTARDKANLKEIKRKDRQISKAEIRAEIANLEFFHPYQVENDLPVFGSLVEKLVVTSKDEFDYNILAEEYNSKLEELKILYRDLVHASQQNSIDTYLWG